MNKNDVESLLYAAPFGGEAWRHRPQTMPYDRPSEFSRAEDALDEIFKNLSKPRALSSFLSLMESGVALDKFVELIVKTMFSEGRTNATMLPILVPPLTVMFFRICDAAGINPKISQDPDANQVPMSMLLDMNKRGQDKNKMDKANNANQKSREQLKEMTGKMGLMKRPEGIM